MSWDLILKAVEAHTDQPWVLLYVQRWLHAPLQHADGVLTARDRGTPQGSAVSPVLANLFLHYAFDAWMAREFPTVPFERYVDDAVVHCVSEQQARTVLTAIGDRMEQVGLRLHPDKTRIVYFQDGQRRGSGELTSFTFLGYEFRQRAARNKHGQQFNAFLPAISKHALKRISAEVRSWLLHHRTGHTFADLAREVPNHTFGSGHGHCAVRANSRRIAQSGGLRPWLWISSRASCIAPCTRRSVNRSRILFGRFVHT